MTRLFDAQEDALDGEAFFFAGGFLTGAFFAAGFFAGAAAGALPRKARPLQVEELRGFFRFGDGEVGHFFDDPVEVGLAYGVEIGVGGGVHEVDGVRDAVFDGELDGVEVVAEGLAEFERIFFDARRGASCRRRAGSGCSARGGDGAGRRA